MKTRDRMNFWELTRAYPPILIRMLAKTGARPMTTHEIALASRLPPPTVEAISWSVTWDGISIPDAFAFMRACRVDLCDRSNVHRVRDYLRKPRWVFLRKSKQFRGYYAPMMRRYLESVGTIEAAPR